MALSSLQRKPKTKKRELIAVVFAWSIYNVRNKKLCNKVPEIPEEFSSLTDYTKSFIDPLIDETHAELLTNMNIISRASTRLIKIVLQREDVVKFPNDLLYTIYLEKSSKSENYEPEAGDLIVLTNVKPRHINDLKPYVIASVQGVKDDRIQVISSKSLFIPRQQSHTGGEFLCIAVRLIKRIWHALQLSIGISTSISTDDLFE